MFSYLLLNLHFVQSQGLPVEAAWGGQSLGSDDAKDADRRLYSGGLPSASDPIWAFFFPTSAQMLLTKNLSKKIKNTVEDVSGKKKHPVDNYSGSQTLTQGGTKTQIIDAGKQFVEAALGGHPLTGRKLNGSDDAKDADRRLYSGGLPSASDPIWAFFFPTSAQMLLTKNLSKKIKNTVEDVSGKKKHPVDNYSGSQTLTQGGTKTQIIDAGKQFVEAALGGHPLTGRKLNGEKDSYYSNPDAVLGNPNPDADDESTTIMI